MTDLTFRQKYLTVKRGLFDKYYEKLNDKQREAVYQIEGPLLILAGAGSGKTTVLTRRLIERIKSGDSVENFLVVTFMKAAAADVKSKLYNSRWVQLFLKAILMQM